MAKADKPRLGKGLAGMLGAPVRVEVEPAEAPADAAPSATPAPPADPSVEGLQRLSIDSIVPNRYQPRNAIDTEQLQKLADSIKTSGLIQPIAVRPAPAVGGQPRFELIAGERRWRAARLAGLQSIPALVTKADDRAAAEWAIVENTQREDLNPIDRALAFRALIDQFGLSQVEVGRLVGIDRSSVSNFIRLVELEPEIQRLVADGVLSTGHAKALLTAPASAQRVAAAAIAVQDGWSVRQMEAWASEASADQAGSERRGKVPTQSDVSAERAELERQLGEHLGTRVRVQTNSAGTKGRIVIEFFDLEHFDSLMMRLGFGMQS